jgi:hypothetical protein
MGYVDKSGFLYNWQQLLSTPSGQPIWCDLDIEETAKIEDAFRIYMLEGGPDDRDHFILSHCTRVVFGWDGINPFSNEEAALVVHVGHKMSIKLRVVVTID